MLTNYFQKGMGNRKLAKKPKVEVNENIDIDTDEIQGWLDELPSFDDYLPVTTSTADDFIEELKGQMREGHDIKADKLLLEKMAIVLQREKSTEKVSELFGLLKDAGVDDASYYSGLGMSAYELKNYMVAEQAYRLAVDLCVEDYLIIGYKNNLAYLLRRKEIENPDKRSEKEIPLLLRDGVAKKDTFSLINMALFWALEHGGEESWNLADKLASYVDKNDVMGALEWWKGIALADEAEGYLVHLLLVRHGKVASTPVGSIGELFDRVKKDYPEIPDKMKEIVTPFDGGVFDKFPTFSPVDWD